MSAGSSETALGAAALAAPGSDAHAHGHGHSHEVRGKQLAWLALGALGVVYGDIGTSPLYAFKACFEGTHAVARTPANVIGVLSLVFWSLTLVIAVKYLTHIMRADNRGEGGILALLALVNPPRATGSTRATRGTRALLVLGLFGAALLYGDGVITPAISVLGAVEGLGVATHALDRWIVPITVGILVALFLAQRRGTARIGAVFGPVTLVWFAMISAMGVPWIARHPTVLAAFNPAYAVAFFARNGGHGFFVLGAVVLCITGGEALYADMGHFGRRPIRLAWYAVVFPALLVNYFGQGALMLERGDAVRNPFFELVSGSLRYPVIAIATAAAVVASQALISGVFSLTQQAVQLGYCPRVTVRHTSGDAEGQIYLPEVNAALMIACVALVLAFRKSDNLQAAYGIAVTGTMGITSVLFYAVARARFGQSRLRAGALLGLFLAMDLAFFGANVVKLGEGGWFPIAVAAAVFTAMITWKHGRAALGASLRDAALPLELFLLDVEQRRPQRVAGTAVFMTANPSGVPPVLLHHFKHNKVLHKQVALLSVVTEHVPEVPRSERVTVAPLGHGFYQVVARYGFMQSPNVPEAMASCAALGLDAPLHDTSFYLGRETLLTTGRSGMARWRKWLFALMSRNARTATAFFGLPPNRVVEMGSQIEL